MARTALVAAGVLLFFLSLGSAAFAQTDCKKLVPGVAVGSQRPDRCDEPGHRRG